MVGRGIGSRNDLSEGASSPLNPLNLEVGLGSGGQLEAGCSLILGGGQLVGALVSVLNGLGGEGDLGSSEGADLSGGADSLVLPGGTKDEIVVPNLRKRSLSEGRATVVLLGSSNSSLGVVAIKDESCLVVEGVGGEDTLASIVGLDDSTAAVVVDMLSCEKAAVVVGVEGLSDLRAVSLLGILGSTISGDSLGESGGVHVSDASVGSELVDLKGSLGGGGSGSSSICLISSVGVEGPGNTGGSSNVVSEHGGGGLD